ncbi:MAG: hypothetical protein K8L97_25260 [Anaerolineae bacterium]|nr:hypothetical protein [Anaerolineae bacterium]
MTLLLCGWLLAAVQTSAQDATSDLLGRINNLRASKGLPGYALNGSLAAAAQNQAQWMIDNDCAIAHTRPDGSNPRSRARAAGYGTDEVSENIYCGGLASADTAWIFWINSGIHYAGLVNARYKEIGIGSASGAAGTSYVLVFGNPGGPAYVPPAQAASSGDSQSAAPSGPPSYVVGADEHGNIQHQIQEGDTLGQIALIYGYTWADIPTMLALNGMTEADYRDLEIGEIFLVPPQAGTYTPTPGEPPTATPPPPPTEVQETTPEPTTADDMGIIPTPTVLSVALAASVPESLVMLVPTATASPAATEIAMLETPIMTNLAANGVITPSGTSPWLIIALVVQIGVLLLAGFEFLRRMGRR